eukprot:gene13423-15861_t
MNPPAMPARVAAGEPTAPAPESLAASQMEPPPNAWDLAGSSSDSDCDSESDSVSSTENDEAPYTHAATVPTTQPLLATGVRTFVAGLQSASARHLAGLLGHTRAAVAPRDPAPDERPEQSELQARRHPQTPAQATAGRSQGGLTPLLPWSQFSAMAPLTEPHTGTGDTGMPMGDVDMPAATPPATDDISSPGVPGHAAAAAGGSQGTVLQGRSDDANGCQRRQVSRARHLLKVDTSDAATDQPEKPPLSIGGERSWPQHLQQEQAPSHIETAELLGDHDPSAPPSLAPFEIPSEWGEANTGSSLDEPASTVTGTAISRAADPSDAVADARERPFSAFDSGVLRPHVSLEGSARQQQRQPVAVAGTNMSSLHTAVRSSGLSGARPRSGASGAHGDARVSAEAMSLGSEAIGADSSEAERDGQEPQHGISGFWQLGQRPKVPQRVPSLKEEQGTEPIPIPEFETSADLSKIDAPKPSSSQLFHPQKLAEYSEAEADTPEAAPGLDSILSSRPALAVATTAPTEELSSVEVRALEVEQALVASANSSAAGGASLAGYLAAAAAELNASLSTEVEALSNVTTQQVTVDVDELAAYTAMMSSILEDMSESLSDTLVTAEAVEVAVAEHAEGPDPDTQLSRQKEGWSTGYDVESSNIQTFSDSLAQAMANAEALRALQADLELAANSALQASAQDGNALEFSVIQTSENASSPQTHDASSTLSLASDNECAEAATEELQIRWLLSSEIPPPPPVPPPLPPPQPSPAAPLASSAARRLLGRQKSGAGTSSEDREDGALDVVDVDDFELANLRYYRAVQENRHYTVSRTNQVGAHREAQRKYELDLEPYGYDASLNINSDRYNPGLEGLQEDYYGPESVAYNAYDEPRYRPFMPVGEGKHALGTTPAIFLSQVSADSARSLSLFLENSGFLSEDTQEVAASMLLYNAPARVLAYTRATFGFSPGGAYEITSEVTPMDEEFWEPWRDIPKAMCLSIWAVGVVVMWTHDMRGYDAKRRELKLSHAAALRGSLMLQHGTSTLPFLALLWYLGILLRQSTFYMLDTYEVYHDSYALANPLLGTRKNGSEELRMWELEPDTADFNYLSANLKISQMVAQAQHLYWVLQMFGLFLALMNIFRLMAFHSYLAIMSNIWEHAGSHLGHFAATLVFSLTGYAGVLTIVLGEHCEELSTFVDAYSYLLDAFSQQHLESCLPEGLVVGPMRRAVMNGLGFTFTLHIIFTTYNVLLSVFVDAIKIQREMNQGTPSAFVELASFARSHLRGRCVAYPGDRAVLRLLAAAQAHAQRTSPAALAVLNSEPATAPGKREVGEMAPATEGPKEAHPGRLAPVEEQVAVDMAPGVHALGMNIECEELVELLRALVAHPKAEVACIHVALELGIMRLDDVLGPGLPSANILQERVPDGLAGCLMRSPVARCKLSASHPRLTTKRTAKKAPSAALRRLSKAAQDLRRAHTAALQAQQLRTRRLQGSLAQLSAQRSLQAVGLRLGELHTGAPQHRPHGNHWEALFPLGSQLEALLAEEEIQRCARFSLIGLLERASSGARNSPSTRAAARLPVSATPPMPATPAGPHLPAATPGGASRRGDPLAVDKVEMDLTARQWTAALIASAGPQKATVLALQPDAAEEEPGADTRWESSSSLGSASSGSRKSFHALLDLEKRERQARVAMAQAAGHHQRAQAAPPKEAVACVDASCPMPDGLMSSEVLAGLVLTAKRRSKYNGSTECSERFSNLGFGPRGNFCYRSLDSILSSSWRPKRTLEPTHSYAEPQQGEGIRMHSPSSAGSEWKFARLPGDELVSSIGTSRYARGAVADYSEAEADAPEALEGFIPV